MKNEHHNNLATPNQHSMQLGNGALTPHLGLGNPRDRYNTNYDQPSNMENMSTLNQPLGMYPSSRDLPMPNGGHGGFGPLHYGQYANFNGHANSQYSPSMYNHGMGDSRISQYPVSGPAESFERTPMVPLYQNNLMQLNGASTPRTPHSNASQVKKPVSAKNRRNTAPGLTNSANRQGGGILFHDLPPRDNAAPLSVAQVMFSEPGTALSLSSGDKVYVEFLKQQMINQDDAEDNEGMKETWEKLVRTKPHKIEHACALILALFDRSTQTGKALTEKRRTTHYVNSRVRFQAIGDTLRTQKTVCKHILEEPYVMQVIDDPVGATKRVSNNRRVNDQKAKAINLGRENMGLKGKGKGAALERIVSLNNSPQIAISHNNDGAATDSDGDNVSPKTVRPRRRAAAKRAYKGVDDDDNDSDYIDQAEGNQSSPPKRPRRGIGRGRTVQPALQLDTDVAPFTSESSNDPSSVITTDGTSLPCPTTITPSHQHSHSDSSFFAQLSSGLPNDTSSPSLMPPAMRNGAYDLMNYAGYGHPQNPTYGNPFADHGAFNDSLDGFSGPNIQDPCFQLDGNETNNNFGGDL